MTFKENTEIRQWCQCIGRNWSAYALAARGHNLVLREVSPAHPAFLQSLYSPIC